MAGIAGLSVPQVHGRIERFRQKYVDDWNEWLNVGDPDRPQLFRSILNRWKACRGNTIRHCRVHRHVHDYPYVEDLILEASRHLEMLSGFNVSKQISFTAATGESLSRLWGIFRRLPYSGSANGGFAAVVGISKAVMLLSDGRVGPAFDSEVRKHLSIRKIENAEEWFAALQSVSVDIRAFEEANGCSFVEAIPAKFSALHAGRVYDMALGPGAQG
ncbi:hypothetical protein ACFPN2_28020 [Steroidobacter flavus]|uniref:Uncharacterized protein n=1 Tax=Steroidobacter flavus TaxID=1842136 RepID=A0ABV8T1C5_9GAMM